MAAYASEGPLAGRRGPLLVFFLFSFIRNLEAKHFVCFLKKKRDTRIRPVGGRADSPPGTTTASHSRTLPPLLSAHPAAVWTHDAGVSRETARPLPPQIHVHPPPLDNALLNGRRDCPTGKGKSPTPAAELKKALRTALVHPASPWRNAPGPWPRRTACK